VHKVAGCDRGGDQRLLQAVQLVQLAPARRWPSARRASVLQGRIPAHGLRPVEVCNLKWDSIDLAKGDWPGCPLCTRREPLLLAVARQDAVLIFAWKTLPIQTAANR
jgi:integrase